MRINLCRELRKKYIYFKQVNILKEGLRENKGSKAANRK